MSGTTSINEIVGLVPSSISVSDDRIEMSFTCGSSCIFHHIQDCCENVRIEDVNGDWNDLIAHPLLVAEVRASENEDPSYLDWHESATWTFYTFRSNGGSVDVRWIGESNGYYSEGVDFVFTPPPQPTAKPNFSVKTGVFEGH